MLVPRLSTTVLTCDPVFSHSASEQLAYWFKNGKQIATVTGQTNVVLEGRKFAIDQPIPELGFLIIPQVSNGDEGEYWCQRADNGQLSEITKIRVAYLDPLPANILPQVKPHQPIRDFSVWISCPAVDAFPKPAISWLFNEEPIDFSGSRIEVLSNGSLLIRRYSSSDSGFYECVQTNLAGRTKTKIFLGVPIDSITIDEDSSFSYMCSTYFRNGVLWFLIGCLFTSAIVLLYLIFGLICYRYTRTRSNFSLMYRLLRTDPSLAPGFRKVVAPLPEYVLSRQPSAANNHLLQSVP
uniref:Ig-like domain-containing protein n=1 Tax=Acrobeloides nanus TaxID=290746 RepID=A0A914DM41_9BILA